MACGGCGGGGIGADHVAITSGDLAEAPPEVDPSVAEYVVKAPSPDGVQQAYFADYRAARIAWMRAGEGAKLRRWPEG